MMFQSSCEIGAFCRVEITEPGEQGRFIHPQLLGRLIEALRPCQRLAKRFDLDEPPGDGFVYCPFLTGGEHRVGGHGAASHVLKLVGDGAAPFGLQQPTIHGYRLRREVGEAEQFAGQPCPAQQPVSTFAESSPRVIHADDAVSGV